MKDEKLIEQMREAVTIEIETNPDPEVYQEYQLVNDACLRSLANMAKQHFIEQACDAVSIEETSAGPRLFFNDQLVRSWLGTVYNDDAYALVDKLKQAIRDRFVENQSNPD